MRRDDHEVDLLRRVPLFSACSTKELRRIAAIADELAFRQGKILTRQGGPGREMFVLLDGTVKVERNGVEVNVLGPGDFLGEGALVLGKPRNATITATSPLRALVISDAHFKQLLSEDARISTKVHETLAARTPADEELPPGPGSH
jgi:CRP-like cAMP-binding protein